MSYTGSVLGFQETSRRMTSQICGKSDKKFKPAEWVSGARMGWWDVWGTSCVCLPFNRYRVVRCVKNILRLTPLFHVFKESKHSHIFLSVTRGRQNTHTSLVPSIAKLTCLATCLSDLFRILSDCWLNSFLDVSRNVGILTAQGRNFANLLF